MKIRTDFVTNSSSSSFILAFSSKEHWRQFEKYCRDQGYEPFLNYVKKLKRKKNKLSKKHLIEILRNVYKSKFLDMRAYALDLAKQHYPYLSDFEISMKMYEILNGKTFIEEFKAEFEKRLADSDYQEKIDKLSHSKEYVYATVWDSDGGLLEYALRNDLVKNEFWQWNIGSWNIG